MDQTSSEKEFKRIEQELDAKQAPGSNPPAKQSKKTEKPTKDNSLDAVLVAAVLLLLWRWSSAYGCCCLDGGCGGARVALWWRQGGVRVAWGWRGGGVAWRGLAWCGVG